MDQERPTAGPDRSAADPDTRRGPRRVPQASLETETEMPDRRVLLLFMQGAASAGLRRSRIPPGNAAVRQSESPLRGVRRTGYHEDAPRVDREKAWTFGFFQSNAFSFFAESLRPHRERISGS